MTAVGFVQFVFNSVTLEVSRAGSQSYIVVCQWCVSAVLSFCVRDTGDGRAVRDLKT